MSKILIVEDDIKLRNELKKFLENSGYSVELLESFSNTIEDIINKKVDLIILDINIPILNGEIVCRELRKKINTPIIIVTSRNNEIDELISINYGADDFITKPYNTQILLARIERILKRTNNITSIVYNDILINVSECSVSKNGKTLDLSKNEFKIFYFLVQNKNKIITRDKLMNYLWNTNEFIDDNTLTVNINRLRNKLKNIENKEIIKTKRGQGYIVL